MSIIYIITTILLYILILLVSKSDKKYNIVKTVSIQSVLLLCYNTFISYVFTIIHIPITLVTLSTLNILLSLLFLIKILKTKSIQKYYFEKRDIIFITILLIFVCGICYSNFKIPFSIKYLTTDSSIHYISAKEFYLNDSLLLNVDNIKTANAMMPGAYSNIGILFKTFAPLIGEMNLYKVFIIFDIVMLFLAGIVFFETIKKYAKNKISSILAGIISIIYILGYPLNNLLFGYFYLGIGVLIINTIVSILQENFMEDLNVKIKIITLFLLCFELFFSYYLFVPAIYGAIFIFFVVYFLKKNKKLINKELLIHTLIILVIPTILGFCYHVLPGLLESSQIQVANVIQLEGYIYRNLYSNLLLFIPFLLYYLINEKREKTINFDVIAFFIFICYMAILYIGISKINISTYYFYKTYFVLWQLVIYLCFRGICYFIEDKSYGKYAVSIYFLTYITIMGYCLCYKRVEITKDINTNEKITDVMDIYGLNRTILYDIVDDYTKEEIEILKFIKNNKLELKSNNTLILGFQRQEYWFHALLDYRFKTNLDYATTMEHINKWNVGEYKYLVYFNRSDNYTYFKDNLQMKNSKIIYQNETGAILEYKK